MRKYTHPYRRMACTLYYLYEHLREAAPACLEIEEVTTGASLTTGLSPPERIFQLYETLFCDFLNL
jgi:hypothetical protein